MGDLLLLSGGIDSACLAVWRRPERALVIDYGQRPAAGEVAAARAVSRELGVPLGELRVDCGAVGGGLLAGEEDVAGADAPEWWPYRNQLIVTLAAAWALRRGLRSILVGSVADDGARHADGRPEFYAALARVLELQEGALTVDAPALALTAAELVGVSGAPRRVVGWTHSCHRANVACGACPGCDKRRALYAELGWP